MRNDFANKVCCGFIFILISLLSHQPRASAQEPEPLLLLDKIVSIDCQYESVNSVLQDISRQSGVEITYNQILEDDEIIASIAFKDELRAVDAIYRLLRGKNTIIEFDHGLSNLHIVVFEQTF